MSLAIRNIDDLQSIQVIAKNAHISGLYNSIGGEAKIFMILLSAKELGIPPMQALNGGIWNIQGKIEISARLMNAMVRRAGHSILVKHLDKSKCILEGRRTDTNDCFTAQFTMEDAKDAGLAGRSTWKAYAEDMLYSRAMSRLARRLFPDIIGTAYVEGEIQDMKNKPDTGLQEAEMEEIPNEEKILEEFLSKNPSEDKEQIKVFLEKYSNHWKKSLVQSILDYEDLEKFHYDFSRWKAKQAKAA